MAQEQHVAIVRPEVQEAIISRRRAGMGYDRIAREVDKAKSTVRAVCVEAGLGGVRAGPTNGGSRTVVPPEHVRPTPAPGDQARTPTRPYESRANTGPYPHTVPCGGCGNVRANDPRQDPTYVACPSCGEVRATYACSSCGADGICLEPGEYAKTMTCPGCGEAS